MGRFCGALALLFTCGLAACGARTQPAPEAGYERGGIPDLTGVAVIVLPVQIGGSDGENFDRELEYALSQVGPDVDWRFPGALREAIARSPGLGLAVEGLPVGDFLAAEVERIGDPLFGLIYRLAALTGSTHALLPVETREVIGTEGVFAQVTAVLLDAQRGYVLWSGVVRGSEGSSGDLYLSATVADALAQRLAR